MKYKNSSCSYTESLSVSTVTVLTVSLEAKLRAKEAIDVKSLPLTAVSFAAFVAT